MTQKQMTIEQLVLSMFRSVSLPLNEKEYQVLGISKFNVLKRRTFSEVYRTLLLHLIRLSLPVAFPQYSSELMGTFDRYFQQAYQNYPSVKEKIEKRLIKFQELTKLEEQEPFLGLAFYITELFEHRPRKLVYASKIATRINDLFFNFIAVGKEIDIIGEGNTISKPCT